MVYGVEMCLPVVLMLRCVEVAGPYVHVIKYGLWVYLLEQK